MTFRKISSFLMAIVLLISTMSFTVDLHYCGDTLVNTAIFHRGENCGMDMQKPSTEDCSATKENCCNDKQIIIDGQDELNITFDTLPIGQQLFVASLFYSYTQTFEGLGETVISYKDYVIPLFSKQIYKLHETYLI